MTTRTASSTPWVVGTALVGVAVLGIGWSTLVSPQLTAAAQTRDQIATVEQQNTELQARTDELRALFAQMPAFEAELATLQEQVPPTGATNELVRRLGELAAEHGLVVTDLAVAGAALITADGVAGATPVVEEPAETDETDEAAEDGAGEGAETSPTPAPQAPPGSSLPTGPLEVVEGMTQVPVTLTVLGPAEAVRSFTAAVRDGMTRLVLVDRFALTSEPDAEAGGGLPATSVGDVSATLAGFAYTLGDVRPSVERTPEPTGPLPGPPGANPFSPLDPDQG